MGRVVRQLKGGYTGQSGRDELLQNIKTQTWNGLRKLASRFVDRAQSGDKFVSVNNKGKYIEFRGPGGDWMSQQDKMRNTILQVSRAYAMAADPVEGQQDYLKKVYKLLSGMDEKKGDDRLQVFADWSMGKISNEELANQLRARQGKPTQAATAPTAQPTSTNTPNTQSDRRVVDTGAYSEDVLSRLPPELANAQSWTLIDEDGDEVDSFTGTAREAVSAGMDQSESFPEYTYSLESGDGRTFATFSSGGSVYYAQWVIYAARQNSAAAQQPQMERYRVFYQDESGTRDDIIIAARSQPEAINQFRRQYPGMTMSGIALTGHSPRSAAEPTATDEPEESAVSNMWDVWFMHQDPDDEEPSEIRNRVRADSAEAAMADWNRRYPRSPALRATLSLSESKKPKKAKKPKTIVDGALKTLIAKGRSEDEAIADLKKEVDKKFYTEEAQPSEENPIRDQLNAWMEEDQQYENPTERAGFQAKVWPYIQQNIKTILADKGEDGKGSYPASPFAAWLLVQHMDAYPQNQGEFLQQLAQSGLDPTDGKGGEGKLQFLKDRYEVNKWIAANANNKEYFINDKPLPNPTVNVRNPAMFKDAGQVATSRKDALDNAIAAGNKLLVAAVQATDAKTQPSYKQSSNESEEISETLKKVNGKWALVSRHDPKKVLQYYHGAGHPSKEWVSKVERRVHSFSESNDQKPKVFIDMDGVLADFFGEWAKLDGKKHWKDFAHIEDALDLIRKHPTFWTNLPLLPHAKELVRFVDDRFGEYYICSTPLTGDSRSEPGKRAWIREHLQDIPPAGIILTHNKATHAVSGDIPNILIDDYPANINAWRSAGGIGILYEPKNFDKVKKILKGLDD